MHRVQTLKTEGFRILERSERCAEFYHLDEGEDFREITDLVLSSDLTPSKINQMIREAGRRFFLFSYPSDGLKVKGYISFVPECEGNQLLVFLRGGNRVFGLMNPANRYSITKNYTVLATTYRDGVSEGVDEFGGEDVNDVENLLRFLPNIEQRLEKHFNPSRTFMLGGSRGGMQMMLALERSRSLQEKVDKVVSLSGALDIQESILDREGMKRMFIRCFGLVPGENDEKWISHRSAVNGVGNLRKNLPILILQGGRDLRTSLAHGNHMVEKLKENGNTVDYMEFPDGDHCMSSQKDLMKIITDWLEL